MGHLTNQNISKYRGNGTNFNFTHIYNLFSKIQYLHLFDFKETPSKTKEVEDNIERQIKSLEPFTQKRNYS